MSTGSQLSVVLSIAGVYNRCMSRTSSRTYRRINITLPEETIRSIDRVAPKGDRSRFINEAVQDYIRRVGRANVRKLLKEASIRYADSDQRLAEEWFPLEEEAWQCHPD